VQILQVNKVNHFFGGLHAVNNVSFNVKTGIIKAIIGPNGAGKTTLFNLISGKYTPPSGDIYLLSEKISGLKPYKIAQKGISRTFQNVILAHHMTVLENVMIGRHIKSNANFIAGMLNLPWTWEEEKKIKEKAYEILDFFSIKDLAYQTVSNLAFGKQRAVEFARALAAEPKLLLLDEPASGLNIYETKELGEIITKIKKTGITILLVEHDMSLVMDISDEIVVLNYGKKITEGIPREIQQNQEVIKIYLGEDYA
jgi:branched-chain amino acid transport system ATP-binding protein